MENRGRRELLGSLKSFFSFEEEKDGGSLFRPPCFSHTDEPSDAFAKLCIECGGKCGIACQEHIIEFLDDGSPIVNFYKGGCTYCDDCLKACEYGVLDIGAMQQIDAHFVINKERCLSWNSTMCYSCKEACPEMAIVLYGMFRAEIRGDRCTSCGFCVKPCPVDAITIRSKR